MQSGQFTLWPDGEKIPDDDMERIFQQPPDMPRSFSRSALIVGSKGVGKTTLLRYQKAVHEGVALHLSLATELSSLPRQAGLGPLAPHTSQARPELVGNKACSLLSLSIASRLLRKNISVRRDAVAECIPRALLSGMPRALKDWLWEARIRVSRESLSQFDAVPQTRPLVEFTREASEASLQKQGPLLLLLDRADLVSPMALVPLLQLIDQSPGYTALVATRPGHGGGTVSRLDETGAPGDQYDVYNLGLRPLTQEWAEFVREALVAQVGEDLLNRIGSDLLNCVIALSRDSIRLALEAVARVAFVTGDKVEDELIAAFSDRKELYSVAVQTKLRPHHQDYRAAISSVRKAMIEKSGPIHGPITLRISPKDAPTLFPDSTHLSLFIESALRLAALCMPEGRIWVPGDCPTILDVPPLLVWEKGDPWWSYSNAHRLEPMPIDEQELMMARRGPRPQPSIFVAYRMDSEESKNFRTTLEKELRLHPRLSAVEVREGRVPIGTEDWAGEIRRLIKGSSLVVGDCTGMRPEVVFELGFAYGLGITVLPVVSTGHKDDLPYWLRRRQVGEFSNAGDVGHVVASIDAHLGDPSLKRKRRGPPPVPQLVVWLRPTEWAGQAQEQFQTLAQREGIAVEVFTDDDPPGKTLERAALASFLVVTLDGSPWDAFSHYVCGAIVARPVAGYGAKGLARKIVVLEPPDVKEREFTAEGLSRCEDTVIVGKPSVVREEAKTFFKRLKKWARQPTE